MLDSSFVGARCLTHNSYFTLSQSHGEVISSIRFELNNRRELSANLIKLEDLKAKHESHALFGSSVSNIYMIYTDINKVYKSDCGSRLQPDSTLKGRVPPFTGNIEGAYEAETCGYLECHIPINRRQPSVFIVTREVSELPYAYRNASEILRTFPHLHVEVI